jgi:16S rRNA (adenine1518-N6/adenine1519-N6)-dimethyltransferase
VPTLRERYASHKQIQIHEKDALTLDLGALNSPDPIVLVGNLPYNISSVLLIHLLSQREKISRMLFMLQKEVAQRLVADPGASEYGRLSVMVGRVFEPRILFDVGPGAFTPPPKVRSSIVALHPRREPVGPSVRDDAFETLVRQAFSQRRKTLRNSLKGICSEALIRQAGIDPAARPQTVSAADYACLVSQQLLEASS